MRLNEFASLPFGIVGGITVMHPKKGPTGAFEGYAYDEFPGLKAAIAEFGGHEVLQIFALDDHITFVCPDGGGKA